MDVDEFYYPDPALNLNLKQLYHQKEANCPVVRVQCLEFGSNNQTQRPKRSVTEVHYAAFIHHLRSIHFVLL